MYNIILAKRDLRYRDPCVLAFHVRKIQRPGVDAQSGEGLRQLLEPVGGQGQSVRPESKSNVS